MSDVQNAVPPAKPDAKAIFARSWIERLGVSRVWSSIADRGRRFAPLPASSISPGERARLLAEALISNRGEASGAAVARELHGVLSTLDAAQRLEFYRFLATNFAPEPARLAAAAQAYLAEATARTAADLADAAEPVRQELLRRMNMSRGGTAMLVAMRKEILPLVKAHPELQPLEADLLHLLASWFNRGFLELRRIDWNTPAAVLDKLIAYEAVHEIQGWEDLRRRLAPDRRCFGFFHPALPGEPLIFVEVALVTGLAGAVQGLLARDTDEDEQRLSARPSRHGDFLFHLQLPGRAARRLLRQFPDQAGGGGAAHRAAATGAFFDALPGARLCRLAGQAWFRRGPSGENPAAGGPRGAGRRHRGRGEDGCQIAAGGAGPCRNGGTVRPPRRCNRRSCGSAPPI